MLEPVVISEQRDGILVITLNRPGVRNAVNEAVCDGLAHAMDQLDDDPSLLVGIVTGAPPGFSSGMDLKAFVAGERVWDSERGFAGITRKPSTKPLIAAVEGFALAGGLEIALSCDMLVAARDARFGVPEVTRSLVATGGALLRLPLRIPANAAMELALTGDLISADEAFRLGFVNRLCESGQALESALEMARRIAANGPLALAATTQILREAPNWGESAWRLQDTIAAPVLGSEDAQEGAIAFAEKRPPRWLGR